MKQSGETVLESQHESEDSEAKSETVYTLAGLVMMGRWKQLQRQGGVAGEWKFPLQVSAL